ncbi:uncharacterized protein [Miscanthus floridulus]|uniref:uncharacterized protein n=1 Tax=Miscanthus floridulus TaxID=154761 RepID=UPI0034589B99
MKRSGDIASLFQKYESKKKAYSQSPMVAAVPEEQMEEQKDGQDQDRVIEENVTPTPMSEQEDEPIYDISRLPLDPGERQPIANYPVNDQDAVRRSYIIKGPFQPYAHQFESRKIGNRDRQFNPMWFYKYPWIEYSVKKEATFCFVCYLFGKEKSKKSAFVEGGWRNWNRNDALDLHVGGVTSAHNAAQERYNLFMTPHGAIDDKIVKVDNEERRLYKIRLTYSLRCLRFLLQQGLAFRGHDESEESSNRGNFIELLKWLAANNEEVNKFVLKNAPDDTTSSSLKEAIQSLLVSHGLTITQIRGQGYDGASNIKGEIKGLKTLIMKESPSAYYVHCFAHHSNCAHLMLDILGHTNELSECLQRKDQDILNAMSLVRLAKSKMQQMRSEGWVSFFQRVTIFCNKYGIQVPGMEHNYVPYGRSARFAQDQTNDDHFRREVYIGVIDKISQELDSRFDEVNMELLTCMATLNPADSFASFDANKVHRLAKFYPNNFSISDLLRLDLQLETFIDDMRKDEMFKGLNNLVDLSVKLVEAKRDKVYHWVYLLIKLVLLLPVATASVERIFSAMTFIKNKLRNKMGDSLLDDCLVTFIERDMFLQLSEEEIINTFMAIRRRRPDKKKKK